MELSHLTAKVAALEAPISRTAVLSPCRRANTYMLVKMDWLKSRKHPVQTAQDSLANKRQQLRVHWGAAQRHVDLMRDVATLEAAARSVGGMTDLSIPPSHCLPSDSTYPGTSFPRTPRTGSLRYNYGAPNTPLIPTCPHP